MITIASDLQTPEQDLIDKVGETIDRMTFWDDTGKGEFKATFAIQTARAVVLYPYDVLINA